MPAINQLASAHQVTAKMVTQALSEARQDDSKMAELQTVVAKMNSGVCKDPRQWDRLLNFVQQFHCDSYEVVDARHDPVAQPARHVEARITKVRKETQQIRQQPPTPPSRPRWRDPLNITGQAQAGAKVEFYNASQPGRPPLGDTTVDGHGNFIYELTDETKFAYGDQIGVRVVDGSGEASRPIIVPTEPFEIHELTTERLDYSGNVQSSTTSQTMRQLRADLDDRQPFYQDNLVGKDFNIPQQPGQPHELELQGGDDAVEPNSTLTVRVGNETYETKADELGRFALKVKGFQPGDLLTLEVRDPNNNGVDFKYQVPELTLNTSNLSSGTRLPPSPRQRDARQTVGDGPPWLNFKTNKVTDPYGVLMMRNETTGDLVEVAADGRGRVDASVGGFDVYDTVTVAARDQNGNVRDRAEAFVLLPSAIDGSCFVHVDQLSQEQPEITKLLQSTKGPPVDILHHGEPDPHGPFLRMPNAKGLPPHGQLEVLRDGQVIQRLRADEDGNLHKGFLRGVHVGDTLDFRVLDAAGRAFPQEYLGWAVPDKGKSSKVLDTRTHTEDFTLKQALGAIGTGSLDLHRVDLDPYSVSFGPTRRGGAPAPQATSVELNYPQESFGPGPQPTSETFSLSDVPADVLKAFQLPEDVASAELTMQEQNGSHVLSFSLRASSGGTLQSSRVGIDYVMGRVNQGDPNNPIDIPRDLASLTTGLKGALATVATAYDHGQEPGDASYDRAMSAVKSYLYVFDRLGVEHKDIADNLKAIQDAAKSAFPAKGFPFELYDPKQVPPKGYQQPAQKPSRPGSTVTNMLEQRIGEQGPIVGSKPVTPPTQDGDYAAPQIDSAIIVRPGSMKQQGINWAPPLRVRGRGNPGDIVQVYNASAGGNQLLAETVVGSDGTFRIVGNTSLDVKLGDQLAIVGMSRDGKKQSARHVVPTDSYSYRTQVSEAQPTTKDERKPFIHLRAIDVEPKPWDKDGNVRDNGPYYLLNGEEMAVEPNSTVTVYSTAADGSKSELNVQADNEGKFQLEFPAAPHQQFSIGVEDPHGQQAATQMRAPSLTAGIQKGDRVSDGVWGQLRFQLEDGSEVHGTIVATEGRDFHYGQEGSTAMTTADAVDGFADVVLEQKYQYTGTDGKTSSKRLLVKVKVPHDEADALRLKPNETVTIDAPSLATLSFGEGDASDLTPIGEAKVLSRDYGLGDDDRVAQAD